MLRTTRNWSKIFYVHFPGRRNHFSKGDLLKNAKGPRLTWMSACWLVEVFAQPITAEDTSKLISDMESKQHCDWWKLLYLRSLSLRGMVLTGLETEPCVARQCSSWSAHRPTNLLKIIFPKFRNTLAKRQFSILSICLLNKFLLYFRELCYW